MCDLSDVIAYRFTDSTDRYVTWSFASPLHNVTSDESIMRYSLKFSTLILSGCMAAGMQLCIAAEDNVGLGLYLKPEYPGAKDYETVVLPSLDVTVGEVGISLKGVDLSVDLIPSPALNTGLTIRYDEGRDDTESDEIIRLMEPVDATAEFGLFIESGIPLKLLGVDDPALLIGSANLRTAFGSGHGSFRRKVQPILLRCEQRRCRPDWSGRIHARLCVQGIRSNTDTQPTHGW